MTLAKETVIFTGPSATPLDEAACLKLLDNLSHLWQLSFKTSVPYLQADFTFTNFAKALNFTNKVAAAAELANHHPTIQLEWGKVRVCWWTHKPAGLSRNDFVMAARCDVIMDGLQI
jgi:4a-hydroxytetrahydrobiopterin dehydratase